MKKLITALCLLLAAACLATGALAAALDFQVPTLDDMLIKHRVFLSDVGDTFEEYVVLFYYSGSTVLVQMNDETHFHKDAGYTMDYLSDIDMAQYYSGYDRMDFAEHEVSDAGTSYNVVVRFTNLNTIANWDMMLENGLLPRDPLGAMYDADALADKLIAGGMRELDMTEYGGLGLDFEVK